jgi:hypothetical protein
MRSVSRSRRPDGIVSPSREKAGGPSAPLRRREAPEGPSVSSSPWDAPEGPSASSSPGDSLGGDGGGVTETDRSSVWGAGGAVGASSMGGLFVGASPRSRLLPLGKPRSVAPPVRMGSAADGFEAGESGSPGACPGSDCARTSTAPLSVGRAAEGNGTRKASRQSRPTGLLGPVRSRSLVETAFTVCRRRFYPIVRKERRLDNRASATGADVQEMAEPWGIVAQSSGSWPKMSRAPRCSRSRR